MIRLLCCHYRAEAAAGIETDQETDAEIEEDLDDQEEAVITVK
jgi:hypothetical protein